MLTNLQTLMHQLIMVVLISGKRGMDKKWQPRLENF
jgi:hypothetical protein